VTDSIAARDAYARTTEARVVGVEPGSDGSAGVVLDRTVFYPGGGGQPSDSGWLRAVAQRDSADPRGWTVPTARRSGSSIVHAVDGEPPSIDEAVTAEIDWTRRHLLMRTHTALHTLCGVVWRDYGAPVTGGNMEPLTARMDFELDPTPEGFGPRVEQLVAAEVAADRPIEVSFVPRSEAVLDEALIRTKVSLVPESVAEIRVVDIVGLDKQADGGTHVRSTGEVGRVRVVKTESKGKGNKRVRIAVEDT
jgi:misacylated tRNA(Ala) deacylase